jgi:hypothetical protein
MFVSAERALNASFPLASSRLAGLAAGGGLRQVSQAVYDGGVAYLMRVGPAGAVPGMSRLVRVRFTDPAFREGAVTVGMRWEAAGVTGALFPALDADIRLTAAGDGARVTLTGSYRPPLGAAGAGLDRLLLRTVATATIRTLLAGVADVLEGAPAEAGQPAALWQPEPGPEAAPG